MKKLRNYVIPYWKSYIFGFMCLFGTILLEVLAPQVIKIIVNEVFLGGNFQRFTWLLISLVLIGIGRSVCGYFKEYTFDKNSQKIATSIRQDLFAHIQKLSMNYFDNSNTGEIMARVKDDVDKVKDAFGMTGMLTVQITAYLLALLVCMFTLSPILTILPFVVMVSGIAMGFYLEKKFDKVYSDLSEENALMNTVAEENLAGVRTVKAFAREKYEIEKFRARNKHYFELNMKQTKVMATFYPIYMFMGSMLPVACAMLGGLLVIRNEMDLGSLIAYIEYTKGCTWPLDLIAELANELSSSVASYKKLKEIADEVPTIVNAEKTVELPNFKGDVRFENVSLEIEGKQILSDISLDIPKGKTLGIMGATGSGKSSLINLLQRFYDPSEGRVTMDGVDVKELALTKVRAASAVVLQDVFLFSDSIEENIKMGKREVLKLEEVKTSAQMAQASTFIEKMEEQYATVIGEKGVGLSGGQKQRISIARALSKKAPILVMDDSTSALDMETEHEIQTVLKGITDATKIIIAHRISAVRNADEIVYLEEGKIAERGTHEELLAKKGLYYNTYMAQYPEIQKEVV